MGGVAGHLNHIHENLDFTFCEIKSILSTVATADIEVVEKVDGQNVFFTWDAGSGQIRTARNATDIKKGGMTPDEYASKWAAHPNPNVAKAFMNGFNAVKRGLLSLSQEQLLEIFGQDGKNYINAEIMYTKNPNMIVYSGDWIVLHNMQKFGEGTEKTIETSGEFSLLVDAISSAEAEIDSEGWRISGPQRAQLQDLSDGSAFNDFTSSLDSVTGMSDDSTIGDYVAERLRTGPIGDLPLAVNIQEEIINTILSKEGFKEIKVLKKSIPKDLHKTVSAMATKTNSKKTISRMVGPIEKVISDFAIEVLRGLKSFFVDEHDAEVSRMRSQLEDAISKLENVPSDNAEAAGELLQKQLGKLGPIENIASTMEGVVFEHPPGSKVLYKLTGSFAMMNQIVGRAQRMKEADELQNESLLRNYIRMAIVAG